MSYDDQFDIMQNKFYNAFLGNYHKPCFKQIKNDIQKP